MTMKTNHLMPHLLLNIMTLIAVASMLFAYNAWAAPMAQDSLPGVITYQGTLTDDAGQPISGEVDMTFRFYDTPTGGTALWTEAHTGANAVPVQEGLFHVLLGSLTPIPSSVWNNDQLYLGVQVVDEPEMEPREILGAVPYARWAETANDLARPVSNITLLDSVITLHHEDPATTNDNSWHALDVSPYVPSTATGVILLVGEHSRIVNGIGGKVQIASLGGDITLGAISYTGGWDGNQGIVKLVDGQIQYRAEPNVTIFVIELVGYIE